ncbi:hypothetical protein [Mobilicoccus caccae]|uniref:Serine/arginine repetitive matrix protein 2 n=1 Tax=Mobilicoccus caccae TaxID=1859295 RepID=A0ABQ6IPE1_9MICO|nr:hypothetical protein [Mobilicoccus caccae]GMA39195.1 hypothetical protein GCM10025883_12400 [Mobilicoccus caccae]
MSDPTDRPDPLLGWENPAPRVGPRDASGRPQDARPGRTTPPSGPSRPGGTDGSVFVPRQRPSSRRRQEPSGSPRPIPIDPGSSRPGRSSSRPRWSPVAVVLGGVLLLGGLGSLGVSVAGLVTSTAAVFDGALVPPDGLTVPLRADEERTLWADSGMSTRCTVTEPSGGALPIRPRGVSVTVNGESMEAVGAFTARTDGDHRILCTGEQVRVSEADPAVYPEVLGIIGGVFGIVLGVLGITAGMVGRARRGSAGRRRR